MCFNIQKELLDIILSHLSLSDLKSLGLTCKSNHLLCNKLIQKYTIKDHVKMICGETDSLDIIPQIVDNCITLSDDNFSKLTEYLDFLRKLRSGYYGIKFSDFLRDIDIDDDISKNVDKEVLSLVKWVKIYKNYSTEMNLYFDHKKYLCIHPWMINTSKSVYARFYTSGYGSYRCVIEAFKGLTEFEDLDVNGSYVDIGNIKASFNELGVESSEKNIMSLVSLISKMANHLLTA